MTNRSSRSWHSGEGGNTGRLQDLRGHDGTAHHRRHSGSRGRPGSHRSDTNRPQASGVARGGRAPQATAYRDTVSRFVAVALSEPGGGLGNPVSLPREEHTL